jgi:hypothetical protein
MQESAATLISKPAELLNGAPVNNRGNPFQVGCTVIDGGLSPRFFGCQKPDEKIWASRATFAKGRICCAPEIDHGFSSASSQPS